MFEDREDILTVYEVAELLCVGKNRVYKLLESGELYGFQIGRVWKIPKLGLELYVRKSSGIRD